ncbi:hypothetical protein KKG90_03905 [Candidatus Bipolaricaulota bacterium]|nr:hypothetical protein [Candidatus Bipolaricaulota bacterium]
MLIDGIKTFVKGLPATMNEKRGVYSFEAVVAERKAFLSKKKLTYCAKFRVDDDVKELRFTEMLKESGSGVSGGDAGTGFKKESYRTGTGPRQGSIEEQSKLFGAHYSYTFDFSRVRAFIENETVKAGYTFSYQITPRGL